MGDHRLGAFNDKICRQRHTTCDHGLELTVYCGETARVRTCARSSLGAGIHDRRDSSRLYDVRSAAVVQARPGTGVSPLPAAGISDTLPLGLLVEAVGKRQPVVAMPFSNHAQLSFPAIQDAITKLTTWGVTILVGDDIYKQHEPGTGDHYVHLFPWHLAWQALLHHPWMAHEPAGNG